MRLDKNKALKLRKQGKSYSEIKEILDIPKSTLSFWLKDIKISKQAREKIEKKAYKKSVDALIKRNKEQTIVALDKANNIRLLHSKDILKINKRELFLIGISLYWAEGYKRGSEGSKWKCVDFSNSDPVMIKLMMKFFREICSIEDEKFKIQLMLHEGMSETKALKHWVKITGLSQKHFLKVSLLKTKGKKKFRELSYGTLHVRVYDTDLFHKIIGWIDGLKNIGV